jgi:signal transduction histidine kinase
VTSSATSEGTVEAETRPDVWFGGRRRWDVYFAVILIGTLAIVGVAGPAGVHAHLLASGALVAMVPWYVVIGGRALYSDQQDVRLGTIYLAGLIPLLAVAETFAGTDTFLLLALCPQCFMAVPYRRAVAATVVMNGTPVLIAVARHGSAGELALTLGVAALGSAFSIAFGSWILRIMEQSSERAELITQLQDTRTQLAQANREAGMLAERERLAGEIHDTIAQGFTSIVLLAQAAEAVIDADPALARHQLALVIQTARENLEEARALVAGMTPVLLASATLADVLARLTERAAAELGIAAAFEVAGTPRSLGTGTEVVLLRVCQEALSNIRKHAQARVAQVRLSYADCGVSLEVVDDGVGFDPELLNDGYGVRGMRTRVGDVGGTFAVRSAPGAGTAVSVEVVV